MEHGEARSLQVVVVPGDDAAPEAVAATLEVLDALGTSVRWDVVDDPGDEPIREAADAADSVLFGATNGRTGGIGYLRWGLGTFANVRPIRYRPGAPSPLRNPEQIDYVIVRENLEDVYCGLEGDLAALLASPLDTTPHQGRTQARYPLEAATGRYAVKVVTENITSRVARFSFDLARRRRAGGHPGRVTVGAKWNVLPATDGYFLEIVRDVSAEYPDVQLTEFLADDLARRLVASPSDFDVILLPNLYGDVLSDEGAATVGGLGVVASGCYGEDSAYFEPVHGTAPDIAGRHQINPTATMLSAAMLLEHLGLDLYAERLESAIDSALAARDRLTPDLGGTDSTEDFAAAVAERL